MNIFRGIIYFLEWDRRLPNPSDWPVLEDRKFLRGGFCFDVEKGSSGVCLEVCGYPHPMPEAYTPAKINFTFIPELPTAA
jgi:hypothetical protein